MVRICLDIFGQKHVAHKVLEKMILEEAFTGKKPKVGYFKIFGNIAYCHVLTEMRTKLDSIAKEYFIGYNETSKAYMIYIPGAQKIIMR